jgi:chromosomal replication initiation ATPase DnaA
MREINGVKPGRVITEVEKYYGIEGEAIRKRGQKYTEARYVASYLMRRYGPSAKSSAAPNSASRL